MPAAEKDPDTIEPWPAAIAGALVVLIAGVAIFTAWDRVHNSVRESVVNSSAVGDTHYVRLPATRTGPTGLKYQGRALDILSESKIRDSKLVRVGAEDSGMYGLYRFEDEKQLPKDHYLMKVSTNDFIEVTGE